MEVEGGVITLRPILIPTKYTKKIDRLKSIDPFRRSVTTNTVTLDFYTLHDLGNKGRFLTKLFASMPLQNCLSRMFSNVALLTVSEQIQRHGVC